MREMKDSGIEWIGELPIGWETRKIKYVATLNGRIGWQGLTSSEYCDDGAYLITGINFDNGQIDWSTCVHVPMERWAEAPQIQIQNGDLLITKDGTVGKVAIVSNMPSETSLNSGVLLIRTVDSCYKKYLFWILQSEIFWKWFNTINAGNSTIIHLYQYDFCNFSFPFPQYSLQCNIANYLDRKCSQIEAIIARQPEVIEKLKAYKLSIITEAVTKGLNPDVPMKDSGVDWIGAIPEHWETASVSRVATVVRGASPRPAGDPRYFNGQDVPWITVAEVTKDDGKYITATESYLTEEGAKYSRLVEEGTLLLSNSGATLGVPKVTLITGCINDGSVAFFNLKVEQMYLLYIFKSRTLELRKLMQGYGQPNLNTTIIKSIAIPVPHPEEQKSICKYLDKRCKAVDDAIKIKEKVVDRLAKYKKSLIYEVVTGKKAV